MNNSESNNSTASKIYEEMNKSGEMTLINYSAGKENLSPRTFNGTGFVIAVLFDKESNSLLEKISDRLSKIFNESCIEFSMNGVRNGIPYHGTILDGKYVGSDKERLEKYITLKNDTRLNTVSENLSNLIIKLDSLVITSSSILMAASVVPIEILETKEIIKSIFKDRLYSLQNFKPKDPILFITIARLKKILDKRLVLDYLSKLQSLKYDINSNPIEVKTASSFVGFAINLIPKDI